MNIVEKINRTIPHMERWGQEVAVDLLKEAVLEIGRIEQLNHEQAQIIYDQNKIIYSQKGGVIENQ
jgi:hypothetical protein